MFVYLIARGHKMHEHAMQRAQAQEAALRDYVQSVAATDGHGTADELVRLADLRTKGVISEAEFQQEKARILGT